MMPNTGDSDGCFAAAAAIRTAYVPLDTGLS